MKVLFDGDVPAKLERSLPRHAIHTVVGMQWGGIKDGALPELIERERFDAATGTWINSSGFKADRLPC